MGGSRKSDEGPFRVHLVAGARPNFMKIAPLYHALSRESWCQPKIIHTGQHYDPEMSESFFKDLGLPKADYCLEAGSGSHARQTAAVMVAYETVCLEDRPNLVIVVGDVNSTLAASVVAKKLCLPVAHLEAGLRSNDRSMPEEINRIATDSISDYFWTPSADADENLIKEGIAAEKIRRVGNIMIDSFCLMRQRIETSTLAPDLGLKDKQFVVVTLHRPSNVDSEPHLTKLISALVELSQKICIAFPIHPRTRKRLEALNLLHAIEANPQVRTLQPLGYIDFMSLVSRSRAVITDSGGVQEETTYLGIPCLTLRDSTERPATILEGSNCLTKPERLLQDFDRVLNDSNKKFSCPALWDGKTANRIVDVLRGIANV